MSKKMPFPTASKEGWPGHDPKGQHKSALVNTSSARFNEVLARLPLTNRFSGFSDNHQGSASVSLHPEDIDTYHI